MSKVKYKNRIGFEGSYVRIIAQFPISRRIILEIIGFFGFLSQLLSIEPQLTTDKLIYYFITNQL